MKERLSISKQQGRYNHKAREISHSPVRALFHSLDYLLLLQSCVAGIFLTCLFATTGFTKELLGHYGKINLSDIKTQAEIINHANARMDQEYEQLYTCLMSSLTPEDRNTVNLQQSDFINGNECSGVCLFKFIVYKSQSDSPSTMTTLLRKCNYWNAIFNGIVWKQHLQF